LTPRTLAAPLGGYRIGDPDGEHPVFSPEGAARVSGRWHEAGDRVVYASEH
jgi:RES domain-containing protein